MTARHLLTFMALTMGLLFSSAALAQQEDERIGVREDDGVSAQIAQGVTEAAAESEIITTEADLPNPIGTGLRKAATPVAEEVHAFYEYVLLPMKLLISFFVLGLIIWVVVRYNKDANPVARRFSHNTIVEVAWTGVPVLILLIIALPSFDLLYLEDTMPDGQRVLFEPGARDFVFENDFPESRLVAKSRHLEVSAIDTQTGARRLLETDAYEVDGFGEPEMTISLTEDLRPGERLEVVGGRSRVGRKPVLGLFGEDQSRIIPAPTMTIKAAGYQWGWAYSYPDFGDFEFDALIAPADTVPAELFRLAATNEVVVPAGETVRVITTGRDVIHSWAMPAFGVKIDAIPGRLNETWFYTEQEGSYYGQCSEICGKDHAFMPIEVKVVSRPAFEAWVDERRDLDGLEPLFSAPEQLASAPAPTPADAPALAGADLN